MRRENGSNKSGNPKSLMLGKDKDAIAYAFRRLLKPQPPHKNLMNCLVSVLDTEYVLPIHCPPELTNPFTEPRPNFRTFQFACQGKVTHWKPERPISTSELCSWILENLKSWGVDYSQYKSIVVCSHYLLAEAQHFTDVREKFKSWGSTLYGEVDFNEPVNFNPSAPDLDLNFNKVKFRFVDTYALFCMSLEKLTETTPHPKRKNSEMWRGKEWKWWRAHPDKLFQEDETEFWKYADNDTLALEWCVHYWRKWVWDKWSIDILRTRTFSGIGLRILKVQITEPLEPYIEEEYLDKNGKAKKQFVYDDSKKTIRDFGLDCYWAGARLVAERGLLTEPVFAYDVSKEYTTAAIAQPLPNAHTDWIINELDDSSDLDLYEGFLIVRFEFPDSVSFPCLPVIDTRFPKQIYPLKGVSQCGVSEARLAKRLGAKVWIIQSCVFKPTESEINHPIRKVLEEILALANEGKGTPQERFMKAIANGLIGKLIQRNKAERREEEKWKERVEEASITSWSPILAALITSKARSFLNELMTLGTPVYSHTDSVFSKTRIDENAQIIQELKKFGSEGLKLDHIFKLFWTPRSACYYGVTEDGKIRTARQGISGIREEDFIKTIQPKIGNPNAPNRTEFVSLKMATFKDKWLDKGLLGHEIVSNLKTDFDYDHKRKLLNPNANLWTEFSGSVPWNSIDELLGNVTIKKTETKLIEGFERQRVGKVGRPKVVTEEDLETMRKLVREGLTRRRIAIRFRGKYSQRTVYRSLPK